jgi:hypothetical protein
MGKGTCYHISIVGTTSIVVEENYDCLASIEHRYYVEVLNNPLVIEEWDQGFR